MITVLQPRRSLLDARHKLACAACHPDCSESPGRLFCKRVGGSAVGRSTTKPWDRGNRLRRLNENSEHESCSQVSIRRLNFTRPDLGVAKERATLVTRSIRHADFGRQGAMQRERERQSNPVSNIGTLTVLSTFVLAACTAVALDPVLPFALLDCSGLDSSPSYQPWLWPPERPSKPLPVSSRIKAVVFLGFVE